jgi:hypothetical protein
MVGQEFRQAHQHTHLTKCQDTLVSNMITVNLSQRIAKDVDSLMISMLAIVLSAILEFEL